MKKQIIKNELIRKIEECKNNPDISPVDVVNDILDFINKCPDEETIPQKVDKWLPKKEHIDTLFKIYNTFLELIGTPRV